MNLSDGVVAEPFDKLLRYGQSLDYFDPGQVGQSVFYDDLGYALIDKGVAACSNASMPC